MPIYSRTKNGKNVPDNNRKISLAKSNKSIISFLLDFLPFSMMTDEETAE
jgi:hypothetical protein